MIPMSHTNQYNPLQECQGNASIMVSQNYAKIRSFDIVENDKED